jgi:hypothetical protein
LAAHSQRLQLGELQEHEKEHAMNPTLKSTPVLASALTAFLMTAPTGAHATPAGELQISPVQHELLFSEAAAEAIRTKVEKSNAHLAFYPQAVYVQAGPPEYIQYKQSYAQVRSR